MRGHEGGKVWNVRVRLYAAIVVALSALISSGCGSGDSGTSTTTGSATGTGDKGAGLTGSTDSGATAGATYKDLVVSDDEKDHTPKSTFGKDTAKIFVFYTVDGAKAGDKLKADWICVKSDVAPANYKIADVVLDVEKNENVGDFSLSKPTKGWPVGDYKVDLYINDKLIDTVTFNVK